MRLDHAGSLRANLETILAMDEPDARARETPPAGPVPRARGYARVAVGAAAVLASILIIGHQLRDEPHASANHATKDRIVAAQAVRAAPPLPPRVDADARKPRTDSRRATNLASQAMVAAADVPRRLEVAPPLPSLRVPATRVASRPAKTKTVMAARDTSREHASPTARQPVGREDRTIPTRVAAADTLTLIAVEAPAQGNPSPAIAQMPAAVDVRAPLARDGSTNLELRRREALDLIRSLRRQ